MTEPGTNAAGVGLQGRRVLITGGGAGLGAHLAAGFAAAGADVVIAGRHREALDAVAAHHAGMRVAVADVTQESDVAAMFAAAGPIDVVVANAGAAESAPLHRTELELWQRMIDVNLTGAFLTLRDGLRQLRGRQWGRLITIASTAGLHGAPYVAAYSAAKHGAVGLTRSIAAEVAGSGITANALCPGYLDTEMTARTIERIVATTGRSPDEALAAVAAGNASGRLVQPGEVTRAALWLCAGDGPAAPNGQAIEIDGTPWEST